MRHPEASVKGQVLSDRWVQFNATGLTGIGCVSLPRARLHRSVDLR